MPEFIENTKKTNKRFNKKEQRDTIEKINKKIKQSCYNKELPFQDFEIKQQSSLTMRLKKMSDDKKAICSRNFESGHTIYYKFLRKPKTPPKVFKFSILNEENDIV